MTYIWHGRREDDDLKVLAELSKESEGTRPYQIVARLYIIGIYIFFNLKMYECLIQVQN